MTELTLRPIKRLIENAGAKRVSKDAAAELAEIIERKTKEIAELAQKFAKHSGRVTVSKDDVKMAAKAVLKQ